MAFLPISVMMKSKKKINNVLHLHNALHFMNFKVFINMNKLSITTTVGK